MGSGAGARIGGYRLVRWIGEGGTGTVWEAVRSGDEQPVALKVVRSREAHRAALREVGLAVRLNHPGIVRILDHGIAEDGTLWLASELAEGSLVSRCGRVGWEELRTVLDSVLEALAHAHAHGVLHRDLKPANLLRLRGRAAIADFGVGRAVADGRLTETPSGTPSYMAPEQWDGRVADQGPWTDLFALGMTARALAGGPSELVALGPDGTDGWMARMVAFRERDRFSCAADARHALQSLGGPEDGPPRPPPEQALPPASTPAPRMMPIRPGPMPEDWRPGEAERSGPRASVGVALAAVALVGREAERDRLWGALRAIRAGGGVSVACVVGPQAIGRSALLSWLATRAAECGAARVIRVDGAHGVLWALSRACRGRPGARGPIHLLRASTPDPGRRGAVLTGIGTALAHLASDRPVLLAIDDAELDPIALSLLTPPAVGGHGAMIAAVLSEGAVAAGAGAGEIVPLGVLSASEHRELLRERLGLAPGLVDAIGARTHGHPGLAIAMIRALDARGLLRLGPDGHDLAGPMPRLPASLAEAWRERASAISAPARALLELCAVLGPIVTRAELVALGVELAVSPEEPIVSEDGIAELVRAELLSESPAAGPDRWSIPEGLRQVVLDELAPARSRTLHDACARVLAGRGSEDAERAARHCMAAGRPAGAVDGLLRAADERISARQPWVAIELLALASEAFDGLDLPETEPRRVDALLIGARARMASGRYSDALDLLVEAEGRAHRAGRRETWREARLWRAELLCSLGRAAEADALMSEVVGEGGSERERWVRGIVRLLLGDPAGALPPLSELASRPGPLRSAAARVASAASRRLGRPEEAARWGEIAMSTAATVSERADAALVMADLALTAGDIAAARARCSEALALRRRIGAPVAMVLATLGAIELDGGMPSSARRALTQALSEVPAGMHRVRQFVLVGLVGCAVAEGRPAEVARWLDALDLERAEGASLDPEASERLRKLIPACGGLPRGLGRRLAALAGSDP